MTSIYRPGKKIPFALVVKTTLSRDKISMNF